jgi:hypothetical protein
MYINDDSEYCFAYYEKNDTTVASGSGYALQSRCRIDTHAITNNNYVTTIGSVCDGNKEVLLAAIYSGDRQIGIYTGGDPRQLDSYYGLYEHDWTIDTTYKLVSDLDSVNVYVAGSDSPSININYDNLPYSNKRRVRFGALNPEEPIIRSVIDSSPEKLLVRGTWTSQAGVSDSNNAYYGAHKYASTGSSDESITFIFENEGNSSVYCFYPAKNSSTDAPFTIYHSGVVELPTEDSYSTSPVTEVNDNIDENGLVDANATTIDIAQNKLSDGRAYNSLDSLSFFPSGFVYLGTYTDIDRVVLTCDATGNVYADTVMLRREDYYPRARSYTRFYEVSYTVGSSGIYNSSSFEGGFSVIDMTTSTEIDFYNTTTTPTILDDGVNDFDVSY